MQTIGNRIEKVIRDRGLTLEEFAKRLGVSKSAVSKWINDQTKNLKNENLIRIEDEYGVSMRWLIDGHGDEKVLPRIQETAASYSHRRKLLHETIDQLEDDELDGVQIAAANAKRLHDTKERVAELEKRVSNGS